MLDSDVGIALQTRGQEVQTEVGVQKPTPDKQGKPRKRNQVVEVEASRLSLHKPPKGPDREEIAKTTAGKPFSANKRKIATAERSGASKSSIRSQVKHCETSFWSCFAKPATASSLPPQTAKLSATMYGCGTDISTAACAVRACGT